MLTGVLMLPCVVRKAEVHRTTSHDSKVCNDSIHYKYRLILQRPFHYCFCLWHDTKENRSFFTLNSTPSPPFLQLPAVPADKSWREKATSVVWSSHSRYWCHRHRH